MGDERPLHGVGEVVFQHTLVRAVVAAHELLVSIAQLVARQRLSLLGQLMHPQLELREHDLPEERGADPLQRGPQVEEALTVGEVLREQMLLEQDLVGDGGDLGRERHVARRLVGVLLLGQHRVHGVAPLVHQSGHVVVLAVVVEQQVGMPVVDRAVHVGAGRLAGLRIDVHPVVGEPLAQERDVLVAERRGGGQSQGLGLVEVEGPLRRDERGIDVVVAQLVEAEHPPAEPEAAVERRQVAVGRGDQCPVDRLRNVRSGQRGVESAGVAPRPGLEHVRLDVGVERLPQGRRVTLPCPPERVEDQLPVGAHAGGAVLAVGGLVETHLRAGRQRDRRKRHIRAGEHREHALRSLPHRTRTGDDRLRLVRQRVRLLAQDVADVEGVPGQTRLGVEITLDGSRADAQQLRRNEAGRLLESGQQQRRRAAPFLRLRDAPILVGLEEREHVEPDEILLGRADRVERLRKQCGALAEPALVPRELPHLLLQARLVGPPGVEAVVDLRQVPLDLRRRRRSGLGCRCRCHLHPCRRYVRSRLKSQ